MPPFIRTPPPTPFLLLTLLTLLTLLPHPIHAIPFTTTSTTTTLRSNQCPVVLPEDPPTPDTSIQSLLRTTTNQTIRQPRIVNGDLIADALVPYLVAIYRTVPTASFKCTGTLVSSRWVLSAAHCEIDTTDVVQLLAKKTDQEAVLLRVASVASHRSYAQTASGRRFDIVAFQLDPPAPSAAKFMKVNVNTAIPKSNSFVRVAGFGDTFSDADEPDSVRGWLRQVDVPITSNGDCEQAYPFVDSNAQLCAGYLGKGGCDACQGDSGGPMIQYTESGEPILVGIVSSGRGCAEPDFPGIYIRTAAFSTWMDRDTSLEFQQATDTKPIFKSGLSTGAIAGIAVCALVVVVAAIAIFLTVRRRRAAANAAPTTNAHPPPGPVPPPAMQATVGGGGGGGYHGLPPTTPADGGSGFVQLQHPAPVYAPGPGQVTGDISSGAQPVVYVPPPMVPTYTGQAPSAPVGTPGVAPYTEQVYVGSGAADGYVTGTQQQQAAVYPSGGGGDGGGGVGGVYGSSPMVYANVNDPPATGMGNFVASPMTNVALPPIQQGPAQQSEVQLGGVGSSGTMQT